MDKLSVAFEHRAAFEIFYSAANKHLVENTRALGIKMRRFKIAIEQPLLQLAADKLTSLFGDAYMNEIPIEFEFFTTSPNGNSGGTDFVFDDNPEIGFQINFNKNLKAIYHKDIRLFCLTLADVFTHELIHGIQYIKQYQSVGIHESLLKESLFKNKEHHFLLDSRYKIPQYTEDLPYFSKHEELACYAKDTARQLLTIYKDKKIIFDKLSNTDSLEELSKVSDCFYYYYDCFYVKIPGLEQYQILWHRFIKHLCHNINEDFAI